MHACMASSLEPERKHFHFTAAGLHVALIWQVLSHLHHLSDFLLTFFFSHQLLHHHVQPIISAPSVHLLQLTATQLKMLAFVRSIAVKTPWLALQPQVHLAMVEELLLLKLLAAALARLAAVGYGVGNEQKGCKESCDGWELGHCWRVVVWNSNGVVMKCFGEKLRRKWLVFVEDVGQCM